jgi:spermidine synthase
MTIVVSESAGVRALHFGSRWIQGAMRVQRPHQLELEYTRDMLVPLLFAPATRPASVLVVGLGAGSFVRWFARHRPDAAITAVERDPRVVEVARSHFRLPAEGPRLRIVIADAVDAVPELAGAFDLVLVDGFDARGSAGRLESVAFYRECRARMAPDGWLAANLLARTRGVGPGAARLAEAFEGGVLRLAPCASGNTIVLASREPSDARDARVPRDAVRTLRAATGLDLRDAVARLPGRRAEVDAAPPAGA